MTLSPRRLLPALALAAVLGCAAPERPGQVGSRAPELVTTSLAGDTVTLSSLRGQPVLLNLWATWCHPCRRETPLLQALHEEHQGRGLRVVGVSVDTRGAQVAIDEFIAEFGVTYTILRDPDMVSMDRYAVIGLPGTYLIDRDGIVRWSIAGPIAENDPALAAALEGVLE